MVKMKKKLVRFALKFLSASAFIMVSGFALFFAFGYQYDQSFRSIEKTSIIDIPTRLQEVQVLVDGVVQSRETPVQVKGILPGHHLLTVTKEGFLPWSREIMVRSDFVSQIKDILLFPTDPKLSLKALNSFVTDVRFYPGKDSLAVVRPGQDYFTFILFLADGTLQQDEITLKRPTLSHVEIFDQNHLLLTYLDKTLELIDLSQNQSILFHLPDVITRLEPSFSEGALYFSWRNNLYRVPFEKLSTFVVKNAPTFLVLEKVDQFSLARRGFYYLQKGQLFFANDFQSEGKLVSYGLENLSNLAFFDGKDYGFLVLRKGKQRLLHDVLPTGQLVLLTPFLKESILVRDDMVLYKTMENEIIVHDAVFQRMKVLTQADIELLGWFGKEGHFLYRQGDTYILSDITSTNVYPLNFSEPISQIFTKDRAFYYLTGQKLKAFLFALN